MCMYVLRWNDKFGRPHTVSDRVVLRNRVLPVPKRLNALSIFRFPTIPGGFLQSQMERLTTELSFGHTQSTQNSFDSVVALAGIDSVVTCPV